MRNYKLTSMEIDPVKIWSSEDGLYKIIKRPNTGYVLKKYSLLDILGEELGEFETLEEAMSY